MIMKGGGRGGKNYNSTSTGDFSPAGGYYRLIIINLLKVCVFILGCSSQLEACGDSTAGSGRGGCTLLYRCVCVSVCVYVCVYVSVSKLTNVYECAEYVY